MFKIAFGIVVVCALLLGGAFWINHQRSSGPSQEQPVGPDMVEINGKYIDLSHLPESSRAKILALIAKRESARQELRGAENGAQIAQQEESDALTSLQQASVGIQTATNDLQTERAIDRAEQAAWNARNAYANNMAGAAAALGGSPGGFDPGPMPVPSSIVRQRTALQNQAIEANPRIRLAQGNLKNARLAVQNAHVRVTEARAQIAEIEAAIADLLQSPAN